VVEFWTSHTDPEDFFRQGVHCGSLESELVEEIRNIGQRHQTLQAKSPCFDLELLDQHAAMSQACEIRIYCQASYLAEFGREDFEGNAPSKSKVLFADEKTAESLNDLFGRPRQ
ncbi:uncharacterized protein METZ01_LOCUS98864, partial [marine metagenome]